MWEILNDFDLIDNNKKITCGALAEGVEVHRGIQFL